MPLRALGVVWLAVVGGAITVVGIAATWFVFLGGILDLFTDKMLTSGITRIDDANRDALATYGGTPVGLFKVFILEPLLIAAASIALGISNIIGMAVFGIGLLPKFLRERRREA